MKYDRNLNQYGLESLRSYLAFLASLGKAVSYSELAEIFYMPEVGPANRKHQLYKWLEEIHIADMENGIPPRTVCVGLKAGDMLPSNGYFRLLGIGSHEDRKAVYERNRTLAKRHYGGIALIIETTDSYYYPLIRSTQNVSANDPVVSQRILVNGVEVSGDHQQIGRKH